MLRNIVSLLLLIVSAVNALTIVSPAQGSQVTSGATITVLVTLSALESGVTNSLVVFQSPSGSQSVNVLIGSPTQVTLNSNLLGSTSIAAIPIFDPLVPDQVANPGFSNIFIGPRPVPNVPCYNPCFNPCFNPCYNPCRPICAIPRQSCRIPRRNECNIPRPRCRIRGIESSESSDSQPELLFSGFSVYYAQAPESFEQFEQEQVEQQQEQQVEQQQQQEQQAEQQQQQEQQVEQQQQQVEA